MARGLPTSGLLRFAYKRLNAKGKGFYRALQPTFEEGRLEGFVKGEQMANYKITLMVDAAKRASVEKKLRIAFGEEVPIHSVEKLKTAESRADRLSEAEGLADDARQLVEELQDEMEQWYDSIPENLQQGSKAQEVEEARDALDSLKGELEGLSWDVSFPGMF